MNIDVFHNWDDKDPPIMALSGGTVWEVPLDFVFCSEDHLHFISIFCVDKDGCF